MLVPTAPCARPQGPSSPGLGRHLRHGLQVSLWCGVLFALSACGGGSDGAPAAPAALSSADASPDKRAADVLDDASADDIQRTTAAAGLAAGTLRLASANAAGLPRGGSVCALSADGNLVLFSSDSAALVSGDTNGATDLFIKQLSTGAVTRVNTNSSGAQLLGGAGCLGMTPDGSSVAFTATVSTPGDIYPGGGTSETAIMVKHLPSGRLLRATPPLASLPQTLNYSFSGLSDDGNRLAFVAQPTTRYLGGYLTAVDGPARLLVADLASGTLLNLESDVRWPANNGTNPQFGTALLSPNGQQVAFTAGVDYPSAGDANGKDDVFVLDLATRAVRLLSTDGAGQQAQIQPATFNPPYALLGFLGGGSRLAFALQATSSFGPGGVYFKHLGNGSLVLAQTLGTSFNPNGTLSFSDDGNKLAYLRTVSGQSQAFVRTLATGQDQALATTASGTVGNGFATVALLSRDGRQAAFGSSASNLVRDTSKSFRIESYVKTLVSTAATP